METIRWGRNREKKIVAVDIRVGWGKAEKIMFITIGKGMIKGGCVRKKVHSTQCHLKAGDDGFRVPIAFISKPARKGTRGNLKERSGGRSEEKNKVDVEGFREG